MPLAPNGYGYLYEGAISTGTILYGGFGFVLAYGCARRTFSRAPAIVAVAVLWLASNAFYYMVFEPSMAHMPAMFAVALTLTVWLVWFYGAPAPSLRHTLALGFTSGLVLLVRLQDAPLLLLPYAHAGLRALQSSRRGDANGARRWLLSAVLAGSIAALCFVPQLVVWQRLYGVWTHSPYAVEHDPPFYWSSPKLGAVLFSTFHGLFTWHPIYLLAGVGLLGLARKDRSLALGLAAVLAVETYVIASWWNWWQGAAFGGRMFLSAMWIWVWGLAGCFDWLRTHRRIIPLVATLALLLTAWNGLALVQYRLGLVPAEQPPTWEQMTIARLEMLWRLLQKL